MTGWKADRMKGEVMDTVYTFTKPPARVKVIVRKEQR
jgi:hypothetical protein